MCQCCPAPTTLHAAGSNHPRGRRTQTRHRGCYVRDGVRFRCAVQRDGSVVRFSKVVVGANGEAVDKGWEGEKGSWRHWRAPRTGCGGNGKSSESEEEGWRRSEVCFEQNARFGGMYLRHWKCYPESLEGSDKLSGCSAQPSYPYTIDTTLFF